MRILDPAAAGTGQTRATMEAIPATQFKTVGTDYNVCDEDAVVSADATNRAIMVTLPRAALHCGRNITVRKSAGDNPVNVQSAANELIGGQQYVSLQEDGEYFTFLSDGTEWRVAVHQ